MASPGEEFEEVGHLRIGAHRVVALFDRRYPEMAGETRGRTGMVRLGAASEHVRDRFERDYLRMVRGARAKRR